MNASHVDAIAKAVLYEGYMLYPYRPSSVKNRQRFNFGVLYPRTYAETQSGSDRWDCQTECLIRGGADTTVEVLVRFLKLIERSTARFAGPEVEPEPGPGLHLAGPVDRPWQEAKECSVSQNPLRLRDLLGSAVLYPFEFSAEETTEALQNAKGETVAVVMRRQRSIGGTVEIQATELQPGLFKLRVSVKNLTPFDYVANTLECERESALLSSVVSAHALLAASDGEFISLLETPEEYKAAAAGCRNEGVWPVLVGDPGRGDMMLASPIILYDYPQTAPESPGDLFDGAEIDEILTLRILTMTDEEKREVRESDPRARLVLERAESLPLEHLQKLHGTLRDLHAVDEKAS